MEGPIFIRWAGLTPSAIRWAQLRAPPFIGPVSMKTRSIPTLPKMKRNTRYTPVFNPEMTGWKFFGNTSTHSCWIFQPVMFAFGVYHSNKSKISKFGRKKTCTIHDCELPIKPQSYQDVYVGVDVDTYTLCVCWVLSTINEQPFHSKFPKLEKYV